MHFKLIPLTLRVALLVLALGVAQTAWCQNEDALIKKLDKGVNSYYQAHPYEKIHLHLDRQWYLPGDTIWFKAYIVTGENHKLTNLSRVLYAELIDDTDSVLTRLILPIDPGVSWGNFVLSPVYDPGIYRIRAYTNWMRNDSVHFFDRKIFVGGRKPNTTLLANKPKADQPESVVINPDVQFFAEGGELINGIPSKVAFKAVNKDGNYASISGIITDDDNKEVAYFKSSHLGMGEFMLTPQKGKHYIAKITCQGNDSFSVNLPDTKEDGYSFSVNAAVDSIHVQVAVNAVFYKTNRLSQFYIVAQSAGKLRYQSKEFLTKKATTISIAKNKFPSGIVQFTLLSQSGEPLNERMIFIQNDDELSLAISAQNTVYKTRDSVKIALTAANKTGEPAVGSFSVSVINETKLPVDEAAEHTIFTDLLLTSDLKGHVDQPNYYFTNQTDETRSNLDLLMLTQGFRKFEWKNLNANNSIAQKYNPELSLDLTGSIKTPANSPVAGGKVRVTSIRDYFVVDTTIDKNGRFAFTDLDLNDTAKIIINAHKANGSDNVKIHIDEPSYPTVKKRQVATPGDTILSKKVLDAMAKAYSFTQSGSIKTGIKLSEVKIKDKKRRPHDPVYSYNMQYSSNLNGPGKANQVILGDRLIACPRLPDCLRELVFGITYAPDENGQNLVPYSTRSLTTHFYNIKNQAMAVFIDGTQVGPLDLYNLSGDDVYSVEVLTSVSYLAIYGSNASNGALIVTLKKGSGSFLKIQDAERPNGLKTYNYKGYSKVREFYSPRYNFKPGLQKPDERKTVYWNPNILTGADGKSSFTFFNDDSKGNYRVTVEGIDGYGNLGRQVFRYKVE